MTRLTAAQRAKRETDSALIRFAITMGTVKVKRCPAFARANLDPKRGGGMMPAHLNPLTMGERDAT